MNFSENDFQKVRNNLEKMKIGKLRSKLTSTFGIRINIGASPELGHGLRRRGEELLLPVRRGEEEPHHRVGGAVARLEPV